VILCGLDIASTTGLALMDTADRVITTQVYRASSAVKKKIKRRDEKITLEDVFEDEKGNKLDLVKEGQIGRAFGDFLHSFLIEHAVQHVAIEEVLISNVTHRKTIVDTATEWAGKAIRKVDTPGTNQATIYRLYGLNFVAASVCSRLGIPITGVNQGTWRKAFLGKGVKSSEAKKEAHRQCQRLRIATATVDAAEAAGIVWWLDGHLNPYSAAKRVGDLFAAPPPPGAS
jgi:hypothetical protein